MEHGRPHPAGRNEEREVAAEADAAGRDFPAGEDPIAGVVGAGGTAWRQRSVRALRSLAPGAQQAIDAAVEADVIRKAGQGIAQRQLGELGNPGEGVEGDRPREGDDC